jgi:5,10-methylenetetrahydromethanopterin reductase
MASDMRFSYCMVPMYPLQETIETIKVADELGFYAAYSVDETWWKDPYSVFAAAADKTERIRFGPNVTHVFLREPTLICQTMATLDELTNGRTEIVVSTGNFGLMHQHCVDWQNRKPRARSPSRATSSSTTACTPSPSRCRSTSRSRWAR